MSSPWAPFVFGKLPAHGDFVARGLDEAGRTAWDEACAASLAAARARLGDGFDDAHGLSPAWRFVAGPSALGPGWRAGAVAPSVDSAGRRYVFAAAVQGLSAEEAAAQGSALAQALESTVYAAIGQGLTADAALAATQTATTQAAAADAPAPAQIFAEAPAPATPAFWVAGEAGEPAIVRSGSLPPFDLILDPAQEIAA